MELLSTGDPAAALPGPAQVIGTARALPLEGERVVAELGAALATELEARTALLVPVAWDGDVHHVAVLARRATTPWSPDEMLVAETLANQAALGLALLESESRRVAQFERDHALSRAAHALNVSLELQEVLDTLAREAGMAVGGGVSGVYLLDDDGSATARAGHNTPPEWLGARIAPGEGIAGQVIASGRSVTTADYQADVVRPAEIDLPGIRAGVGVPMRWNGALRGALSIGFGERRTVTREDFDVLEAIADLAVVACHNAEVYAHVRTAASTDALTGLLNHGAMQVRVREEISRAARDGAPLCCVLIDLDDFKRVNDELGHPAGDALLRRVADALRAEVRPYDLVARYGGDEFVLVLPAADETEARRSPSASATRAHGRAQRPGASRQLLDRRRRLGAAAERRRPARAADRALLLAKRTGKGRVAVANPDLEDELVRLQQDEGSPAAVQALAAAIEARDNYAQGTPSRSRGSRRGVALLLGLTADAVERVGHGALLHDVGKLAVPHDILQQGRRAQRRGVGDPRRAPRDRRADPAPDPAARLRRPDRAPRARALGRQRLPGRPRRRQIPLGSRIILACDAYARCDGAALPRRAHPATPSPNCARAPARSSTRRSSPRCWTCSVTPEPALSGTARAVRHHGERPIRGGTVMKYMMFVCSDTEPDTDKAPEPDVEAWVAENDARGRRLQGAVLAPHVRGDHRPGPQRRAAPLRRPVRRDQGGDRGLRPARVRRPGRGDRGRPRSPDGPRRAGSSCARSPTSSSDRRADARRRRRGRRGRVPAHRRRAHPRHRRLDAGRGLRAGGAGAGARAVAAATACRPTPAAGS